MPLISEQNRSGTTTQVLEEAKSILEFHEQAEIRGFMKP